MTAPGANAIQEVPRAQRTGRDFGKAIEDSEKSLRDLELKNPNKAKTSTRWAVPRNLQWLFLSNLQ
jgi:hypothetical protein